MLALLLLAQVPPTIDFARDVQPILRAHCWECHGAEKQKGDLRLDARSSVFHGDRDLWVVVPGAPADSLLLDLVTREPGDPDRMPKDGEPLAPAEIDVLREWIASGAAWPETADAKGPERRTTAERIVLDAEQRARRERALASLAAAHVPAGVVAADTDAVEVDFGACGARADDASLALLEGLEPCLTRLRLARTAITGAGLPALRGMTGVRRLDLGSSAIGDADLAVLADLRELRWLSLAGTRVTDAGLAHLAWLPHLEELFVWRTAVSHDGVARLRAERPGLRVDRGAAAAALVDVGQAAPLNPTCPVTGKKTDAAFVLEIGGVRTAFCCDKCRARFAAERNAK